VFESNTNKEPKHDNQKSCLNVLLTQAVKSRNRLIFPK